MAEAAEKRKRTSDGKSLLKVFIGNVPCSEWLVLGTGNVPAEEGKYRIARAGVEFGRPNSRGTPPTRISEQGPPKSVHAVRHRMRLELTAPGLDLKLRAADLQ